ncbi:MULTISPECIES: Ger(x)C family spore germination C-terminal domain-containing protein [Alicyclobacillus]|uniref:Ger(X)C family germination protein n=1 Tax=Alicyclobacillus tolerans TaxID=90970 RepID=A0ABT9LZA4_9BACL|nr:MULTISPECIES: Ger(x)C family spore germination C-terminal domain-containing protein [Alicyclobacillus]MDP9729571.1 Ger(x)C family germination protein [Alicyclobacillus tengchongensis]
MNWSIISIWNYKSRKYYIVVVATFLILGTVTACDYNDVDHLYISTGIGIDKAKNGIRVSVDLINPESALSGRTEAGGNNKSEPDRIVSNNGTTMELAFSGIQSQLSRSLYLPHTSIILFSKSAISSKLGGLVDALERNRQLRRSQLWVITSGNAEDIFKDSKKTSVSTAVLIRDLVDEESRRYKCLASDELHIVKHLLTPSASSTIAEIKMNKNKEPVLSGLDFISIEGKLYRVPFSKILDVSWLMGRTFDVREPLVVRSQDQQIHSLITIHWIRTTTHLKLLSILPTPIIQVDWRGTGEVERWDSPTTMSSKNLSQLEWSIQHDVENRLREAWLMSTKSGIDVYGIRTLIEEHLPKEKYVNAKYSYDWKQTKLIMNIHLQILHGELASQTPFISKTVKIIK